MLARLRMHLEQNMRHMRLLAAACPRLPSFIHPVDVCRLCPLNPCIQLKMGIVGKSVKFGAPLATLYGSHRLQLWNVSVQSKEAEKRLEQQYAQIQQCKSQLVSQVRPLWPQFDLRVPDWKQNWNCAVRLSVKWISEFDSVLSDLGHKISSAITHSTDKSDSKQKYN